MIPTEVWCAIISGVVTLAVSIGTWHMSAKKDRDKTREELEKTLLEYYEKNRAEITNIKQNELRELKEDVTSMGASLQSKIAVIELQLAHTRDDLNTLSARVEKHNNVIERVFRLEDTDKLIDEKIKVVNHRLEDLEKKQA